MKVFTRVSPSVRPIHIWYPDAKFMRDYNKQWGPFRAATHVFPNDPKNEIYRAINYEKSLEGMEEIPTWAHDHRGIPRERHYENMMLNFGPVHPGSHGPLRLVLQLEGEVSGVSVHGRGRV
jgi:hypothetical protein